MSLTTIGRPVVGWLRDVKRVFRRPISRLGSGNVYRDLGLPNADERHEATRQLVARGLVEMMEPLRQDAPIGSPPRRASTSIHGPHDAPEFARVLREFRERTHFSQADLGRLTSFTPSHISRMEKGDRGPGRRSTVLVLAVALNLTRPEANDLLKAADYAPLKDWPHERLPCDTAKFTSEAPVSRGEIPRAFTVYETFPQGWTAIEVVAKVLTERVTVGGEFRRNDLVAWASEQPALKRNGVRALDNVVGRTLGRLKEAGEVEVASADFATNVFVYRRLR